MSSKVIALNLVIIGVIYEEGITPRRTQYDNASHLQVVHRENGVNRVVKEIKIGPDGLLTAMDMAKTAAASYAQSFAEKVGADIVSMNPKTCPIHTKLSDLGASINDAMEAFKAAIERDRVEDLLECMRLTGVSFFSNEIPAHWFQMDTEMHMEWISMNRWPELAAVEPMKIALMHQRATGIIHAITKEDK